MDVSVVGATGFTGIELIKILSKHPEVNLTQLTTRQKEPRPLSAFVPTLAKESHLKFSTFDFKEVVSRSECVFLALPHTEAVTWGERFFKKGKIVIDLSADFRLKDPALYQKWYRFEHGAKGLLKHAVYGLPEYYRKAIAHANLIANPGCYPTSIYLGLGPLLADKLIESEGIIADSKSGVTGAGRKLVEETQFSSVGENFKAYKVSGHQHLPEIEQGLGEVARKKVGITFVPHLLPIQRGILSTLYVNLKKNVTEKKVYQAFQKKYAKEPFVRVLEPGDAPTVARVAHTNFCDIGIWVFAKERRAVIVSTIDNLLKG